MYVKSAVLLLLSSLVASMASAGDPWVDHSIQVDSEAEREVLRELRDTRLKSLEHVHAMWTQVGIGGSYGAMSRSARAYFEAASRQEWSQGHFEESYRYAEKAIASADSEVEAARQIYAAGQTTLDRLLDAQARRTELKLTLLRYQAIARERGLKINPPEKVAFNEIVRQELEALKAQRQPSESGTSK